MGMRFAPTWLRHVSPPASQNHFNHCLFTYCTGHARVFCSEYETQTLPGWTRWWSRIPPTAVSDIHTDTPLQLNRNTHKTCLHNSSTRNIDFSSEFSKIFTEV